MNKYQGFGVEYFDEWAVDKAKNDMRAYGDWQVAYYYGIDNVYNLSGKIVLDFGCAFGTFVLSCVRNNVDAYGVDVSTYSTSDENLIDGALRNRLMCIKDSNLSLFEDDTFDFIHSSQVFEHVPEDQCDKMISEIMRILKPGGRVYASLLFDAPPPEYKDDDPTHITYKPREWWDILFEKHGGINEYDVTHPLLMDAEYNGLNLHKEYNWNILLYKK